MVCTRAARALGFITRNSRKFKSAETFIRLYRAYVLPILTTASVIWSPHLRYQINMLEGVQHRFLRALSRFTPTPMHRFNHNYAAVSATFQIPTVESVHRYSDMTNAWKVVHETFYSRDLCSLFPRRNQQYDLRSQNPLYNRTYRRDVNFYSSIPRLRDCWNSLPPTLRDIANYDQFKSAARHHAYRYYE